MTKRLLEDQPEDPLLAFSRSIYSFVSPPTKRNRVEKERKEKEDDSKYGDSKNRVSTLYDQLSNVAERQAYPRTFAYFIVIFVLSNVMKENFLEDQFVVNPWQVIFGAVDRITNPVKQTSRILSSFVGLFEHKDRRQLAQLLFGNKYYLQYYDNHFYFDYLRMYIWLKNAQSYEEDETKMVIPLDLCDIISRYSGDGKEVNDQFTQLCFAPQNWTTRTFDAFLKLLGLNKDTLLVYSVFGYNVRNIIATKDVSFINALQTRKLDNRIQYQKFKQETQNKKTEKPAGFQLIKPIVIDQTQETLAICLFDYIKYHAA